MTAPIETPSMEPSLDALPKAYGSFARRMQATLIDMLVIAAAILVTVLASELVRDVPGSGRVVLALFVAELLLYEPVMVWRFGGTVGHRRMNLRVVSDDTGGNPGLLRALARFVIKAMIGLLSFTTMALTQRHQALHDRLTRTTVQIRDPARARPRDFQYARPDSAVARLPSRARRTVVIVAYLLLGFATLSMLYSRFLSPPCLDDDRCTASESLIESVIGTAWLAASVGCVIVGWQGRLLGARTKGDDVAPNESAA